MFPSILKSNLSFFVKSISMGRHKFPAKQTFAKMGEMFGF